MIEATSFMANTYSALYYHIIFSTKNRTRWITPEIEERVWSYLGGIAREKGFTAIRIGGVEDHIHVIAGLSPAWAPSKAVQFLKGGSSIWIHDTFPKLAEFGWQDGYAAFSVSKSQLSDVVNYVARQREHHRIKSFQEEYRAFLDKNEIAYDERYIWG